MAPIIYPQRPQVEQPVHVNPQGINVNARIRRVAVIIMNYGQELKVSLNRAFSLLINHKFWVLLISVRIGISVPAGHVLTAFFVSLATMYTLTVIGCFITNRRRQAVGLQPRNAFIRQQAVGLQPRNAFQVAYFSDVRLNMNHLQIPEIQIDMSEVPANIRVRELLELFDNANYATDASRSRFFPDQKGLNFKNPNEAGYINLGAEKDVNGWPLTKDTLRSSLENLIVHIERRSAYRGSPYAGTPELQQFYTTLENFIRFSIHRRLKEIEQLQERPKCKPPQGEPQEVFKKYDMALRDFTRMTIDLGVLGGACASLWMSGAKFAYNNVVSVSQGSLEERVKCLLARERETIAQIVIAQTCGSESSVNTHVMAAFYAALGPQLGLVGSQGVIERGMYFIEDKKQELCQKFFNLYTPHYIREVIQKAYKLGDDPQQQSAEFRELVLDWFKEQVGDWKRQEYQVKLEEVVVAINELKENSVPINSIPLVPLNAVLDTLKTTGSIIVRNNQIVIRQNGAEIVYETFEDFLTGIFTIKELRQVADVHFQGTSPVVLRNQWKLSLTHQSSLQQDLYKYVKDVIVQDARPSEAALNKKWQDIKEKSRIIGVFQRAEIGVSDVSMNLLKAFREGTDNLRGLLESTLEQYRKSEYLKELLEEQDQIENNEIRPLKEELLDKFLIGHHIFNI